MGWADDPGLAYARALEGAKTAIALDETLANGYSLYAWLILQTGNHSEALAAAEKAAKLVEPGGADVTQLYAVVLVQSARPEEAIVWFERAQRLIPGQFAWWHWVLAEAYRQLGRYEEMIEVSESLIERSRTNWYEYPRLVFAYMQLGDEEKARAYLDEMLTGHPERVPIWLAVTSALPDEEEELFVGVLRKAGFPDPEQPAAEAE